MYNYFMLAGIIYKDLEFKTSKNGTKYVKIPLLVAKSFKNPDGQYDADLFHIYLWDALADIASDNFKKGSKIGIKGRIQSKFVTLENKVVIPAYDLIAERLIFFDSVDYQLDDYDFNAKMTIEKEQEEGKDA